MLPCSGCAYRKEIPGDAHSQCLFDWRQDVAGLEAKFSENPPKRWFGFPFNYDPIWGPDACGQRTDTADATKVFTLRPLFEEIFVLLGGKRR